MIYKSTKPAILDSIADLQKGTGSPLAKARIKDGKTTWLESEDAAWNTGYYNGNAGWQINGEGIDFFTDLHGICPLYYAQSDDYFCCSPSLTAVAQNIKCRDLDAYALSSFFRVGYYCNEETLFKKIRVLPPGVRASWRKGKLELGETTPFPAVIESTYEQAIEGYGYFFKQAISRLLTKHGQPNAMLLSGGRDSRHILLELYAQNAAPEMAGTIQHHDKNHSEVAVARNLSMRLGISHHIIPQDQTSFAGILRTVLTTNFEADEHDWFRSGFAWLAHHTHTATMDGLAGERISGQFDFITEIKKTNLNSKSSDQARRTVNIYELLEKGKIDDATLAIANLWNKSAANATKACSDLGVTFDPDAVYSNVHRALTQCLASSNPLQNFYLRTRTRREVARAPLNMGGKTSGISFPYLDPDLVSYLTSLPCEITKRYEFHSDVIKHTYPDLADIQFSDSCLGTSKKRTQRIAKAIRMRMGYSLHSKNPKMMLLKNPVWWQLAYVHALKSAIKDDLG